MILKTLLVSTYELGHQPFGLASPAAWLRAAGAQVTCLDLAVQDLAPVAVRQAGLVAFYLPMHTATRLAVSAIGQVKQLNPNAHLCCFGLYAPLNAPFLRKLGVHTILGGEFEAGLVSLYQRLCANPINPPENTQPEPLISLARQMFVTPDRQGLPPLPQYAVLERGAGVTQVSGYTEASRGCKHLCRHCPIVPVYNGRFRIVPQAVVLADIRNQVTAGAQHITFGDPDFFNGPGHAIPLVQALHAEFPDLTYDVTIKIEHLLQHAALLPMLRDTGCLFITSAVEAVDDSILGWLEKGHTRADFMRAVALCRQLDLLLAPTFVAFTPWTTLANYRDLLSLIAELDLVAHVAPIQYAIRLLIPAGSRLLELAEIQTLVQPFDEAALVYPWAHPDPQMDALQAQVVQLVQQGERQGVDRATLFGQIWQLAHSDAPETQAPRLNRLHPRPIPHLSENWYC
jgi:radical SAM superfamily enzyme YgiQ (UPF0313 family)